MAPIRFSVIASLVVMLPTSAVATGQVNNGQVLPDLSYAAWLNLQQVKPLPLQDAVQLPSNAEVSMRSQNFLGYAGQQLRTPQVPYAQGFSGPPYSEQQAISSNYGALLEDNYNRDQATAQATISVLQTQLKEERSREAELVAERRDEMLRMNASFAHVLSLAEAGALEERELQEQLAKATSKNQALQAEVAAKNKALQAQVTQEKEKELEKDTEVQKLREVAAQAEQHVKQSAFLQKRTVKVMHDVQVAQDKVHRTEEIIHHLMPRLEPLLKASEAGQSHHETRER